MLLVLLNLVPHQHADAAAIAQTIEDDLTQHEYYTPYILYQEAGYSQNQGGSDLTSSSLQWYPLPSSSYNHRQETTDANVDFTDTRPDVTEISDAWHHQSGPSSKSQVVIIANYEGSREARQKRNGYYNRRPGWVYRRRANRNNQQAVIATPIAPVSGTPLSHNSAGEAGEGLHVTGGVGFTPEENLQRAQEVATVMRKLRLWEAAILRHFGDRLANHPEHLVTHPLFVKVMKIRAKLHEMLLEIAGSQQHHHLDATRM